jgi:phosphoglycolate phosphatase
MQSVEGIKLAIWDLDGTMIDSFGVFSDVMKEAAELSGRQMPTDETIKKNFHGSLEDTVSAIFELADDATTRDILLKDFLRIQEAYYQNPDEHVFTDALRLATRLTIAGVEQVVVTNRAHENRGTASPKHLVENSRLRNHIGHIICGDDGDARKPEPAVLSYLPHLAKYKPEQIMVFGDQDVDASLAQNLGSRATIVSRYPEPVPRLEDLDNSSGFMTVVSSFDEVQL